MGAYTYGDCRIHTLYTKIVDPQCFENVTGGCILIVWTVNLLYSASLLPQAVKGGDWGFCPMVGSFESLNICFDTVGGGNLKVCL